MSTLIVTLALPGAATTKEYDYVLTADGQTVSAQGRATAALLPTTSGRAVSVVALVPARALSWHLVTLPQTMGKLMRGRASDPSRLRAVLAGMMEEFLLDEPDQLHFAIFPGVRADGLTWVAVCHRSWLHEAVQALEASALPVARIVPEFAPVVEKDAPSTAHVMAGLDPGQMVLCTPQGVMVLPLGAAAVAMVARAGPVTLLAEPAVAAMAEQTLKQTVSLQTHAQRQLQAAESAWNLAQFDLSISFRTRIFKALSGAWLSLSRQPQWRPVRWGVAMVLLTLNALAMKESFLVAEKRRAVSAVLRQTFPEVTVIVDAPVQMAREVSLLQQATGQSTGPGLIEVLMATAAADPVYPAPVAIELIGSEFRLRGPVLLADRSEDLVRKLSAQGWRAQVQGGELVIQQRDSL